MGIVSQVSYKFRRGGTVRTVVVEPGRKAGIVLAPETHAYAANIIKSSWTNSQETVSAGISSVHLHSPPLELSAFSRAIRNIFGSKFQVRKIFIEDFFGFGKLRRITCLFQKTSGFGGFKKFFNNLEGFSRISDVGFDPIHDSNPLQHIKEETH